MGRIKERTLKYGEYKAKIEVKDSLGVPKSTAITWRADFITKILEGGLVINADKGDTIVIEILPNDKNFTPGVFTEA